LIRLFRWFTAAFTIVTLLILFTPFANFLSTGLTDAGPGRKKADLIVVLGGGAYRNGALTRASGERLLEGLLLYREGYGGRLIFSGATILEPSKKLLSTLLDAKDEPGATVVEALIMRDISVKLGVPEKALAVDPLSTNTYENLSNVMGYMEANSLKDCLIVTSPAHMLRARLVARRLGLSCRPAPVKDYTPFRTSAADRFTLMREVIWEYSALALYKIYGYI